MRKLVTLLFIGALGVGCDTRAPVSSNKLSPELERINAEVESINEVYSAHYEAMGMPSYRKVGPDGKLEPETSAPRTFQPHRGLEKTASPDSLRSRIVAAFLELRRSDPVEYAAAIAEIESSLDKPITSLFPELQ